MVLGPIPQCLPVHIFGSRPQPPTSRTYAFIMCDVTHLCVVHDWIICVTFICHKRATKYRSLLRKMTESLCETWLNLWNMEHDWIICVPCLVITVYLCASQGSWIQCVAVCCSVLQWIAVCCSVLQCDAVWCSVMQCVAVCCSVLQCVAVRCSVMQCDAVHCSVLKCVTLC